MPNRILKESICTSETLDQLSPMAEIFFYRLTVNCDDYGRFDARPSILLAKCFPLKVEKLRQADVAGFVFELHKAGLITLYRNGREHLQLKTWDVHQSIRAKRSKFPSAEDPGSEIIEDISCMQMQADACICSRNPIQSNPNPNPIRMDDRKKEPEQPNPTLLDEATQDVLEKASRKAQDSWVKTYPDAVWIRQELAKAWSWCIANPHKAPRSAWTRFLNGWLSRGWDNYRKSLQSSPMNRAQQRQDANVDVVKAYIASKVGAQ